MNLMKWKMMKWWGDNSRWDWRFLEVSLAEKKILYFFYSLFSCPWQTQTNILAFAFGGVGIKEKKEEEVS